MDQMQEDEDLDDVVEFSPDRMIAHCGSGTRAERNQSKDIR
jgi:hypothetical protein